VRVARRGHTGLVRFETASDYHIFVAVWHAALPFVGSFQPIGENSHGLDSLLSQSIDDALVVSLRYLTGNRADVSGAPQEVSSPVGSGSLSVAASLQPAIAHIGRSILRSLSWPAMVTSLSRLLKGIAYIERCRASARVPAVYLKLAF